MILTLAVCLGTVALNAQTSTEGSIAGTVTDPSGAVVPGAAVTIHNMGTNAEIKLTSDASGFFKAPLLEPGTYRVTFVRVRLFHLSRRGRHCPGWPGNQSFRRI